MNIYPNNYNIEYLQEIAKHFYTNAQHTHTHNTYTQCTIRDVEESKACSRVIRSRVIGAEALHIVVGANGLLYGRIFAC